MWIMQEHNGSKLGRLVGPALQRALNSRQRNLDLCCRLWEAMEGVGEVVYGLIFIFLLI